MSAIAATYLNYLTPEEAVQFEVARNIYIAVLGAVIWDILIYIPDDIRIVIGGFGWVTSAFVLSRVFSLSVVLLSVIERTTPVSNCQALAIAKGVVTILATGFSSYLFLRRLHAVYADEKHVRRAFSAIWFICASLMVSIAVGVDLTHIPGTRYCVDSNIAPYVAVSGWSTATFDSLVFLAISYKIALGYSSVDEGVNWGTLISGRALPRLSRAVLQGGQQYYLMTVGMHVLLGVLIVTPSMPPMYKEMMATPALALGVSMACRVFRNIRKLDLSEQTLAGVSNLRFTDEHKDSFGR